MGNVKISGSFSLDLDVQICDGFDCWPGPVNPTTTTTTSTTSTTPGPTTTTTTPSPTTTTTTTAAPDPFAANRVYYYHMDELSGTTFVDATGNGHNATVNVGLGALGQSECPAVCTGVKSPLFARNGSPVDGTYAIIPGNAAMDFVTGDSISYAVWVKPTEIDGQSFIMVKGATDGGAPTNAIGFRLNYTNNTMELFINSFTNYYTGGGVADMNWHLIGFTWIVGTGSSLKMYVDGVLQSGGWSAGDGNSYTDAALAAVQLCGAYYSGGYNFYYAGHMRNAQFWKGRILSDSEMLTLTTTCYN